MEKGRRLGNQGEEEIERRQEDEQKGKRKMGIQGTGNQTLIVIRTRSRIDSSTWDIIYRRFSCRLSFKP